MKVGIFDSGVGGLTVLKSIVEEKLFKHIVYYGDTARVPYGSKDKNTIISYSLEALEFFKNFDLDIIIIACNSVSAYALDELRANTNIPIVGVIESGIIAVNNTVAKDKNILVIGTKATIQSELYEKTLRNNGYENIISLATPLFVSLVEENILDGAVLDEIMNLYFNKLEKIDTVILGCTHFPLLQDKIGKYFNNAKTIHSGDAITQVLKDKFNLSEISDDTKIEFFASSNPSNLKYIASQWLKI